MASKSTLDFIYLFIYLFFFFFWGGGGWSPSRESVLPIQSIAKTVNS